MVAMLFIVNSSGDTAHATVSNLVAGSFAPAFWIAFVLAGLVLPAIIETFELFVNTGAPSRTLGMGMLIGGFALRALIVLAALPATIVVSFA